MTRIAVCDVGGTHVGFAIARLQSGEPPRLSDEVTFATGVFAGLQSAWRQFGRRLGKAPPSDLAIAFAGMVEGNALKLTNGAWTIHPRQLKASWASSD